MAEALQIVGVMTPSIATGHDMISHQHHRILFTTVEAPTVPMDHELTQGDMTWAVRP